MLKTLLFALASAGEWAAADGAGDAPEPKTYPGDWITPADYPSIAIAKGVTGRTHVEVLVNEKGRPIECRVTASSGASGLDVRACELIEERASFFPARDRRGKAVSSVYRTRVVWKIPEDTPRGFTRPLSFEASSAVVSFVVEIDGTITECKIEEGEVPGGEVAACPPSGSVAVYIDDEGKPHRRRVRFMQSIEVEDLP